MEFCFECILLLIVNSRACFSYSVPENFYGSSEVFSGYLTNRAQYEDAFTMHENHVLISGDINSTENQLALSDKTGKTCKVKKV